MPVNTSPPTLTHEQKIQRLYDVYEIEKVMAKHVYYHALAQHHEELDDIWVRNAPDPHFAQNQGYYIGYDSLRSYYGDLNLVMQKMQLEAVHRRDPSVEISDDNLGVGLFQLHPLTTQIIEVAEDGETAKGIWYSPGAVGSPDEQGVSQLLWMWEKYGVDFLKEDGEWRIWHLHTYTDFGIPVGDSWADQSTNSMVGTGVGGEDEGLAPGPGIELPAPDRAEVGYRVLSYRQPPQNEPRIPEPYRTFTDTFSY